MNRRDRMNKQKGTWSWKVCLELYLEIQYSWGRNPIKVNWLLLTSCTSYMMRLELDAQSRKSNKFTLPHMAWLDETECLLHTHAHCTIINCNSVLKFTFRRLKRSLKMIIVLFSHYSPGCNSIVDVTADKIMPFYMWTLQYVWVKWIKKIPLCEVLSEKIYIFFAFYALFSHKFK